MINEGNEATQISKSNRPKTAGNPQINQKILLNKDSNVTSEVNN